MVPHAATPCANIDPAMFPNVSPHQTPVGTMILVQLALPPRWRTLPNGKRFKFAAETQDKDQFTMTLGRVAAVGNASYRLKDGGGYVFGTEPWVVPGDYVHVPAHNTERFFVRTEVPDIDGKTENVDVYFSFMRDTDVIGVITDAQHLFA